MKPSLVIDYEKLHIFNPYKSTAILLFFGSRPLPFHPLMQYVAGIIFPLREKARDMETNHGGAAVTGWGVFKGFFFPGKRERR
jgi:hypothetical protein